MKDSTLDLSSIPCLYQPSPSKSLAQLFESLHKTISEAFSTPAVSYSRECPFSLITLSLLLPLLSSLLPPLFSSSPSSSLLLLPLSSLPPPSPLPPPGYYTEFFHSWINFKNWYRVCIVIFMTFTSCNKTLLSSGWGRLQWNNVAL